MRNLNQLSLLFARWWGYSKRYQLYPKEQVIRPWPANIREIDKDFFAKNRKYDLPISWLLHLREANLYWDGTVFHGLKLYPETLVLPDKPTHNWRGLLSLHIKLKKKRLSSELQYLLIHDSWSASYYHWMVDALPRLLAVREQLADKVLLIPEDYNQDYQQQTLSALGVTAFEYLKAETHYIVPFLVVPSRLARIASYNPSAMRQLRTLLLDKFPLLPKVNLGDKIYISRERATRRKILNENEVTAYMRLQGFTIVELESYAFAEQASIMARARYLVSIHGAGLTNMLFMIPGSSVLELQMQDDGTNHYYYTLAADLNINYYYQFCAPVNPTLSVQDADLIVNMTDLAHAVTQMLS